MKLWHVFRSIALSFLWAYFIALNETNMPFNQNKDERERKNHGTLLTPGQDKTRLFMNLSAGTETRCTSLLSSSPRLISLCSALRSRRRSRKLEGLSSPAAKSRKVQRPGARLLRLLHLQKRFLLQCSRPGPKLRLFPQTLTQTEG